MAYAYDITITSTHVITSATKQYIQSYLSICLDKTNKLTLNPDKTTCTLFTPNPAKYTSNLDLKINNTALHMVMHPKVMGLTLDPKLTYSTHIHNILMDLSACCNVFAVGTNSDPSEHIASRKKFHRYLLSMTSKLTCRITHPPPPNACIPGKPLHTWASNCLDRQSWTAFLIDCTTAIASIMWVHCCGRIISVARLDRICRRSAFLFALLRLHL